jgi:hypothetical protein
MRCHCSNPNEFLANSTAAIQQFARPLNRGILQTAIEVFKVRKLPGGWVARYELCLQ